MREESFKLLESAAEERDGHVKLFGFDLAKDDEPWQFVLTFKLPGENAPDELLKVFEEDVMEPSRKWQEFRTVEPFFQLIRLMIRPLYAFQRV